jgi:methylthioribose-1-phosphate isomerase
VCADGSVANKVGTYGLAVLANAHDVPFVVVAPTTTIDLGTPSGSEVEIEQRAASEVTEYAGVPIAPAGTAAYNPAFDVTPARLIAALVTERGVVHSPDAHALRALGRAQ